MKLAAAWLSNASTSGLVAVTSDESLTADLYRRILYQDPTGEKAARLADWEFEQEDPKEFLQGMGFAGRGVEHHTFDRTKESAVQVASRLGVADNQQVVLRFRTGRLVLITDALDDGSATKPATAATAELALSVIEGASPVMASTIRTWAHRGKVRKYGLNAEGKRLYDLDDIIRLATAKDPR